MLTAEETKEQKDIYITNFDLERLMKLIKSSRIGNTRDVKHLQELENELKRAKVVDSRDIPGDRITMNSKVCLADIDSGDKLTITLTFPSDSDRDQNKISVLAPIGTAIIGYSINDTIEWEVPGGLKRLKVLDIIYQPEKAGDYHL